MHDTAAAEKPDTYMYYPIPTTFKIPSYSPKAYPNHLRSPNKLGISMHDVPLMPVGCRYRGWRHCRGDHQVITESPQVST
jgi:hypothetical protein